MFFNWRIDPFEEALSRSSLYYTCLCVQLTGYFEYCHDMGMGALGDELNTSIYDNFFILKWGSILEIFDTIGVFSIFWN